MEALLLVELETKPSITASAELSMSALCEFWQSTLNEESSSLPLSAPIVSDPAHSHAERVIITRLGARARRRSRPVSFSRLNAVANIPSLATVSPSSTKRTISRWGEPSNSRKETTHSSPRLPRRSSLDSCLESVAQIPHLAAPNLSRHSSVDSAISAAGNTSAVSADTTNTAPLRLSSSMDRMDALASSPNRRRLKRLDDSSRSGTSLKDVALSSLRKKKNTSPAMPKRQESFRKNDTKDLEHMLEQALEQCSVLRGGTADDSSGRLSSSSSSSCSSVAVVSTR